MSDTTTQEAAPPAIDPGLAAMAKDFSAGQSVERKDVKGRTLKIVQLSLLDEMNLIATAGGDRASNRRWMMYATMVSCVRAIDGVPVPFPMKSRDLEYSINTVGAEGVAAVAILLAANTASEDEPDVPAVAGN